jgi:hypothetical protein
LDIVLGARPTPGSDARWALSLVRRRSALAVGLTVLAIAIVAVMSQSPPVVSRTNASRITGPVATVTHDFRTCQDDELLPAGTTEIRLSLEALLGPPVLVRVIHHGVVVASGSVGAGWSRQSVTIPVKALGRPAADTSVCFTVAARNETVYVKGAPDTRVRDAGTDGRIRIEYLRPGGRSWWALAPSVARRMALGRSPSGVAVVVGVLAAMLALTAIVSWLAVRAAS